VRPLLALSSVLARAVDLGAIDGIVNGVGRMVTACGAGLRRVQSGYVVKLRLDHAGRRRGRDRVPPGSMMPGSPERGHLPPRRRRWRWSSSRDAWRAAPGRRPAGDAVTFALSVPLWTRFDGDSADFQFEEVARGCPRWA
jgi:hypothetical protein